MLSPFQINDHLIQLWNPEQGRGWEEARFRVWGSEWVCTSRWAPQLGMSREGLGTAVSWERGSPTLGQHPSPWRNQGPSGFSLFPRPSGRSINRVGSEPAWEEGVHQRQDQVPRDPTDSQVLSCRSPTRKYICRPPTQKQGHWRKRGTLPV